MGGVEVEAKRYHTVMSGLGDRDRVYQVTVTSPSARRHLASHRGSHVGE